ncbi:hypothetical protein K474DRAFT_1600790 [Panus rudis PR-1116 ss-1]|nr:hypothetical protein K474DRAFT_1600790 [Panus rudis PR-1116 ss-1]
MGDADKPASTPDTAESRSTFGPFTRVQRQPKSDEEPSAVIRAVFIFLRSLGKIYLLNNGQEYTFYMPFEVRRAWPLWPHGVAVQRVLEPLELDEARVSGENPLPTLFTIINPHAEPAVVGITAGLVGGFEGTPTSLKDDMANKTMNSLTAEEFVVWSSPRGSDPVDHIFITLNTGTRQLTVWRHGYVPHKDLPDTSNNPRTPPRRTDNVPLPPNSPGYSAFPHRSTDSLPLAALPGMPPSLSTKTTMQSIMQGNVVQQVDISPPAAGRPSLGGHPEPPVPSDVDHGLDAIGDGRMKPIFWLEKLYSEDISEDDAANCHDITAGVFNQSWDGKYESAMLGVCLPASKKLFILHMVKRESRVVTNLHARLTASSVAAVRITRGFIYDLLLLRPDKTLTVLTHGIREVPIHITNIPDVNQDDIDVFMPPPSLPSVISSLKNATTNSVTLSFAHNRETRVTFDLLPRDILTKQCLIMLAMILPDQIFFDIHREFLFRWSKIEYSPDGDDQFEVLTNTILDALLIPRGPDALCDKGWDTLAATSSFGKLDEDPCLQGLELPPSIPRPRPRVSQKPSEFAGPVLTGLHHVGLSLWVGSNRHKDLLRLVSVICKIAHVIRPEWVDFWKRLCPTSYESWPSSQDTIVDFYDDRLQMWPSDLPSVLFGKINNPEWNTPWTPTYKLASIFNITPSFAFSQADALLTSRHLSVIYMALADNTLAECRKRAEKAILQMVKLGRWSGRDEMLRHLPLSISAPLQEAARTCQLSPSGDWPREAFKLIGRNDLVKLVTDAPELVFDYGYRTRKEFLKPSSPRKSLSDHTEEVRRMLPGEMNVSGVELGLKEFLDVRFAQDRRVDEVARMLCSSNVVTVKAAERPDLNELDQARELQNQILRLAERTMALPFGRAMFTFGSVTVVTRETYRIPKMEYTARLQQQNVAMVPDPTKVTTEVLSWADFHNGVAAGLRISHAASSVDSSWIKFNKPAELTPDHAGFLFALGLTGHLRELLTWHTFSYLTPKHDLTTTAVLVGLSAAYAGSSDRHVTKLIAVHLPALLPTPNVDLNITLVMQSAALSSLGLLYLGTKNRRMAEVCIQQIGKKDLVPPDLSNDYREACTMSAALAFGMIMLGKGSEVPADVALFERLCELIHGMPEGQLPSDMLNNKAGFDLSLTSPAATIALGLMYLRTDRRDVAETLVIPDTVAALDRVQPHYLLLRALAKSLILWSAIVPTDAWLNAQLPSAIAKAMQERIKGNPINDSFELAYYNIVAGCCFALGLKYAGTAREEAYSLVVKYYDAFARLAQTQGPNFDSKIKRAAVNDGLNLISISLSMIMAGTGEIGCLRRFRYQYGKYNEPGRYGSNVATNFSIGLLFLGGGRFTLGTSDASIACMVAAFFPRFPQESKEQKCYLQALRHLWVLAVEPRCLIAKDVDSQELVYLPVKMKIRDNKEVGTIQLICPTLIPEVDKVLSLRVDTPRYWPFYLDIARNVHHKESLLRSQILYVKRRTAFLSYMEDPKGSRSLFVRSGSSNGDTATLDFPQHVDIHSHHISDLHQFISSASNDTYFLSFADRFCRDDGETEDEKRFHSYCHAALLDCILQDKPWTMQAHLTLYRYRKMSPRSKYFNLALHDLRFATEFYTKVFDRQFSGKTENNARAALLKETTLTGALHDMDLPLQNIRKDPTFLSGLRNYVEGGTIPSSISLRLDDTNSIPLSRALSWYLLRYSVPASTFLVVLKALAKTSQSRYAQVARSHGVEDVSALDIGIMQILHMTGILTTSTLASGWNESSFAEVLGAWKEEHSTAATDVLAGHVPTIM